MNKIDRLLYEAKTIRTHKESNILLLVENHNNVFTAGYIEPLTGERVHLEFDREKALNDYINSINCKTVIIDDIDENYIYVPLYEHKESCHQKRHKEDVKPNIIGLTNKEKEAIKSKLETKEPARSKSATLNQLKYDDPKMEALFK